MTIYVPKHIAFITTLVGYMIAYFALHCIGASTMGTAAEIAFMFIVVTPLFFTDEIIDYLLNIRSGYVGYLVNQYKWYSVASKVALKNNEKN